MDLTQVGGRFITPQELRLVHGVDFEGYWDFGYRQGFTLSIDERAMVGSIYKHFQPYQKAPEYNGDNDIDLTKLWKRPEVIAAIGGEFIGFGQLTGSCVGAGGGNTEFTLAALEVLLQGELERIFLPFWPLTYGRSRYYCGMKTRGEGSLESGWAKAALQDGVLPIASGLPSFTPGDGSLQCGSSVELQWSDGDDRPLIDYLPTSRVHLINKADILRTTDDMWNAIGALKPIGHGSMYGYNVVGKDENGEFLIKRGPRWSHKETILGRRTYKGKRQFLNVNQWFYQGCKIGWMPEEDGEWILNDGEVVAYSGLNGVPEDRMTLDWIHFR